MIDVSINPSLSISKFLYYLFQFCVSSLSNLFIYLWLSGGLNGWQKGANALNKSAWEIDTLDRPLTYNSNIHSLLFSLLLLPTEESQIMVVVAKKQRTGQTELENLE